MGLKKKLNSRIQVSQSDTALNISVSCASSTSQCLGTLPGEL